MNRIKGIVSHLKLRGKLMLYSYAVIGPILLLISILLAARNYEAIREERKLSNIQSAQSLVDSLDVLQSDMQNICTYLCINEDITEILRSSNPQELNQNFQLWLDEAPMNIVLDIIALKGAIKTIGIYPENGVNPYLRCLDSTVYVSEWEVVQNSSMYQRAVDSRGTVQWIYLKKGANDIYQTNRTDKIVLYREIYNLSKKNKLGFLVLGANSQLFYDACDNVVLEEEEGILVLTPQGEALFTR